VRAAVTIIVPGFDIGPYVEDALESVRSQTLTEWKAILVDDASTDRTTRAFEAAAGGDARFTVVRHPVRRGLGAARNTALDLVDTPLVGFLDGDDVLTPGALERLVSALDASGSDFAVGAYVRLRPDGTGGYVAGDVQPWVAAATAPERRATTIDDHPEASGNIVAWSKVSRTGFWREHGLRFPVGKLYEDQIVAQRMYSRARAFDVVPDVVVHWRERADGTSITQGKAELPVLRDYIEAMAGGIAELEAGGHLPAVAARARLILTMDLPPLVRIAQEHRHDEYRSILGAFTRAVLARTPAGSLDDEHAALAAAAALW
jgi:glycosyltransferase involved in cell wall biosynthesis